MSDDPMLDLLEKEERSAAVANLALFTAKTVADMLTGQMPRGSEVAKQLVNVALAFVPEEELRGYLTDGAVARAERLADAASRFARGSR